MGYDTSYKGKLKFEDPKNELDKFLDEDIRHHPEWNIPDSFFYYIDWKKDGDYLIHNGAEKSYDGEAQLTTIVNNSSILLYGLILYKNDYGEVGKIHCNGKNIKTGVITEGN